MPDPAGAAADRWATCLDRLQGTGRLPSVVAGVLQDGELAWTGAVEADPAAQYRIGSITKTMTAVAVLQLRDEGRLDLDDPLGRHLPGSGYGDATLRQMLTHTSGMQSEPVGPWWERSPGIDVAALLAANDGGGAVTGPGEWWHYSNLGFALLGEVVARLRGASWWEVIRQRVLGPLGMDRTTYDAEAPFAQGMSVDHFAGTLTREPHQVTGAMAPAGQLWSTVADLARWGAFLLDGHPDVLAPDTLREVAQVESPAEDYGLGLMVQRVGERTYVGHHGSMPGFQASLFVDPAERSGVVVLAGSTTGLRYSDLPHLFLGGEPVPATARWTPTERVPETVTPLLGLWFWGHTAFEVRWQDDELHFRNLLLGERSDAFRLEGERLVGSFGYHRGETLQVVRRDDGSVGHLECATFVYTRTPYDPDAPVPGGVPERA